MKTYPAAPSKGSMVIGAFTLVMGALAALPVLLPLPWPMKVVNLLIFAPFILLSALTALWLPGMRYELGEKELVLRCGYFRWRIQLRDIQEVSKQDLALNPISSFRGPGYALFKVPYADAGVVTMCSTRSLRDIILIRTGKRKYGITPREEAEFLRDLTRRLEQA